MRGGVVHVEVVGPDPDRLRAFYGALLGWDAPPGAPVAPEVSDVDAYSFVEPAPGAGPSAGGIGGGPAFAPRVLVYFGVDDVEDALMAAVRLGGERVLGPVRNEGGGVVVGHLRDPAGILIGVAGPA